MSVYRSVYQIQWVQSKRIKTNLKKRYCYFDYVMHIVEDNDRKKRTRTRIFFLKCFMGRSWWITLFLYLILFILHIYTISSTLLKKKMVCSFFAPWIFFNCCLLCVPFTFEAAGDKHAKKITISTFPHEK